jgi:hypothetical protein
VRIREQRSKPGSRSGGFNNRYAVVNVPLHNRVPSGGAPGPRLP